MDAETPLYYINSLAPIRICDLGGWTDTWFAEFGQVLHIAVSPFAQVQIQVFRRDQKKNQIEVYAENFKQVFTVQLGQPPEVYRNLPHPLLQATIASLGVPDQLAVRVTIHCAVPSGASTGTSAAVAVALAAAMDFLNGGHKKQSELASLAQSVETEWLGWQCGIQDQLCSAFGSIQVVDMDKYPHATVKPVKVDKELSLELEQRLSLVYLGETHKSSRVHEMVIANLEDAGPHTPPLQRLRAIVPQGVEALQQGDFLAFGKAMIANHEAQRELHPGLISPAAQHVAEIAQIYGAFGWKVNGAGGEGGSITILSGPRREAQRAMLSEIEAKNPDTRVIPIQLCDSGVRVWRCPGLW